MGFIGGEGVEDHVAHALGFSRAWGAAPPLRALDLGSGGGLPGLALALEWPTTGWLLLDANERRTDFLETAATALQLGERVAVVRGRAEEEGRRCQWRGRFDLVTARSFGPPAVTAECASPFLRVGGRLVVSEPPDNANGCRWPTAGLASVGLVPLRLVSCSARYQVLEQVAACDDRYPRRVGLPGKRPLF